MFLYVVLQFYDICNKYIFIVYIYTVLGFVNTLASGKHDVHYNGHFETPPPPPRIFFEKCTSKRYPNTTSDAKNRYV